MKYKFDSDTAPGLDLVFQFEIDSGDQFSLEQIVRLPEEEIDQPHKLDFFRRVSASYGKAALM